MLLAVILIGLALLVFGVVLFNPTTQWKTMRWFVALGLLLMLGGYITRDYCARHCSKSSCSMSECSSDKGHCADMDSKHCKMDKACSRDGEECEKPCCAKKQCHGEEMEKEVIIKKTVDGDSVNIEVEVNE